MGGINKGGINTAMNSLVVIVAKEMMTDESRKNKNNSSFELEGTIKLKWDTIEMLKELSHSNNSETYNSIILRLIRNYKDHHHDRR